MKFGASVMITDSGLFVGEVLQSSRRPDGLGGGRIASLLWALHHRKAVLWLSKRIVEEFERDSPRRAGQGGSAKNARRPRRVGRQPDPDL